MTMMMMYVYVYVCTYLCVWSYLLADSFGISQLCRRYSLDVHIYTHTDTTDDSTSKVPQHQIHLPTYIDPPIGPTYLPTSRSPVHHYPALSRSLCSTLSPPQSSPLLPAHPPSVYSGLVPVIVVDKEEDDGGQDDDDDDDDV